VEGIEGIPVYRAGQAHSVKDGRLPDEGIIMHRGNTKKFQAGATGQRHFGAEPQHVIRRQRLGATGAHHIFDAAIGRITKAAPHPAPQTFDP
jgi:hypothetical protein